MSAVYSAYDNTSALINLLQMVYHNVKHYFQMQIDMQDVNQVLASHFNDFGQKVIEAYIRPLKIKDSVPKYRVPIQSVLRSWAENDALLLAMANTALQDKRGDTVAKCRADLLRKIFWIDERYDNMEHDYLDEIDAQVRRYTRAATQKIENLTSREQNVRGDLDAVLTALSHSRRADGLTDRLRPVFQLYEQSYLSEKSLWYRKRPGKRSRAAAVLIEENETDVASAAQAAALLHSEYGRAAVAACVQGWLGDRDTCLSADIPLENDRDYVMSLLAVLSGGSRQAAYQVEELGGSVCENGYSIPANVHGQRRSARYRPTQHGKLPFHRATQRRRGIAGRRATQLDAVVRPGQNVERTCEIHPNRHQSGRNRKHAQYRRTNRGGIFVPP